VTARAGWWRRYGAWLGLGVVVVVVVAVAAWPRGDSGSVSARTRALAQELRCVDCEGLSVWDSGTDSAKATRHDIAARIRAGESDGQIRRVYVDRYGESVLLKPSSDGVGLLVWALPVVVLVVAAGAIVLALRRWSRQPRLVASEEDEALVRDARAPS
jgi:cytochrome c-type biogenesis protein CcmH